MKRFRQRPPRGWWLLLPAACAVFLALRWWAARDRPERLAELPVFIEGYRTIYRGKVYWADRDRRSGAQVFYAMPVNGGKTDEMGRDLTPGGATFIAPGTVVLIAVTEGGIFYRHGETVRRMPMTGGSPQDVRTGIHPGAVCVAGDTVYWVELHPDEVWRISLTKPFRRERIPTVASGGSYGGGSGPGRMVGTVAGAPKPPPPRFRYETLFHCELMAAPLSGGRARRLMGGLNSYTTLSPDANGVFARGQSLPGGAGMFYFRSGNPKPQLYRISNPTSVVLDGRFYWLESIPEGQALISAKMDGSDRRWLCRLSGNYPARASLGDLTVHQGRLYAVLSEPVGRASVLSSPRRYMVCRIHPERPDPIEKLFVLAGWQQDQWHWFDEGSIYYTVLEQSKNWLDWSGSDAAQRNTLILYRFRLPD